MECQGPAPALSGEVSACSLLAWGLAVLQRGFPLFPVHRGHLQAGASQAQDTVYNSVTLTI